MASNSKTRGTPVTPPPPPPNPPINGGATPHPYDPTKLVFYTLLGVYGLLLIVGFALTEEGGVKWWLVAYVASICHFIASIKVVGEQQLGALILFGKIIKPLKSGAHYAPYPFRVRTETKNTIQLEFGTREADDTPTVQPDTMIVNGEPFRVTFATDAILTDDEKRRYGNDPLTKRLTFDPHVVIRFKVADLPEFIEEIGSLSEAASQIREVAKGAIQSYAGQHVASQMIENIDLVNALVTESVEVLIGEKAPKFPNSDERDESRRKTSWGINFLSASVTSAGLPKRVNEAMADRGQAAFGAEKARETAAGEADSTRIRAAAERERLTEEGVGYAEARRLFLEAEAAGSAALARLATTPEGLTVLQLEALQEAMKSGKSIVIPLDLAGILAGLTKKIGS